MSGNNPQKKNEIEYFRGNVLEGENIDDLIKNHRYYGLSSADDAFDKIKEIIDAFEKILK